LGVRDAEIVQMDYPKSYGSHRSFTGKDRASPSGDC
jgi:hypothetical protein